MEIGLQTFTVRELLTPGNLNEAFGRIAGMGIENLELAVDYLPMPFAPETAETVRAAADRNGLRVRSCQIKYSTSSKDIALTAAYMQALGARILTNSVIDLKLLALGRPGLLRYCGKLDRLKERLAPAGIDLAHHNHHFEFKRAGGQTALEFMAAHSSIGFALDTYWTRRAGGDILALLEALKGRVPLMHLRDFAGKADCEIGRGDIPFGEALRAAEGAGVKYGMIEQKTKTPIESVEISLRGVHHAI
ncbi:MAG: sugar phosphate isomerase/epimerase [Oscillospiraceae bacterium]|jgi:sugar phosphate isomerase/epimerase|nr:sugar phosphate isomerase/epimerase [Oscillospiraceae bacterium]